VERYILFGIISIPVIILSWRSLFSFKHHGFYRFLSWECIVWLLVSNYKYWFVHPFGPYQILSWIFLLLSGYLVIAGAVHLKKYGKQVKHRDEKGLYQFEKTSLLVDRGIYKYIRHPLYASLLVLTWGICLKNPTILLLLTALLSSIFLYLTAIFDERECIRFFGEEYRSYMNRTRRFIPGVF
jgi:protein-S-isoprenylcysteine O-methyltransferase Ste14